MTVAAPLDVLTAEHRHQLEVESAIPADILAEEGVYSLRAGDPPPVPDAYFRHANSWKAQRFPTWPAELADTAALVFPNRDHAGRPNYRLRPDTPRTVRDDDGNESRPKYEGCGGGRNSVYVPKRSRPKLGDVAIPLAVIEGDKKTLAALGVLGDSHAVVGLSGIDCWSHKPDPATKTQPGPHGKVASEPLPDWGAIPLRTRIVFVVPDSDYATNPNVGYAVRRFEGFLKERGAVPVVVALPCKPDGSKMGADDYIADGGDLRRQLHCALYEKLTAPPKIPAGTGTDGAETCRACAGKDAEVEALREEVGEYKAELRLLRSEAVPTAEAQGLAQLATVAASAQSRGETAENIYVPEVAKCAGVGAGTMTRALNQVRRWQADPALAGALPFTVEDYTAGGKDHVRLLVPRRDEGDRPARPRRAMLQALERLPRDEGRGKHGGARDACQKCGSPMLRTTQDRCTNEGCNHVVVHPSKVIGRSRDQDGPGQVGEVVELHGAPFVTEVRADEDDRHQDGPVDLDTLRHQDGAGPLIPVAFVSDEDRELAAGKRYPRPEPPPRPPLPPAPPSHRSWWSRPEYRERRAGAQLTRHSAADAEVAG